MHRRLFQLTETLSGGISLCNYFYKETKMLTRSFQTEPKDPLKQLDPSPVHDYDEEYESVLQDMEVCLSSSLYPF